MTARRTNTGTPDVYWATLDPEELAPELNNRVDDYYMWVQATGRRSLWALAYSQYNMALMTGAVMNYSGAEDEYNLISVNQCRNILKHLMNLTVSQRPAFEPRSTNTDSKSQSQTIIARSLLEYYSREKHMERRIRTALEFASLYGEGFVTATWESDDGEIIAVNPDTQIPVREGDVVYNVYEPMDVVRDVAATSSANLPWYIVRSFVNRWDLIAKYPEHTEDIQGASSVRDPMRNFQLNGLATAIQATGTDLIEVFEFFHQRTAALPEGRYCKFLYGSGALLASVLPYHKMPVYRLSADDIQGQPFGYGTIFDLLQIQQAVDASYSTIQTNQSTFGVQNIAVPKGSNLTSTQVTGGMNLIEYNNTANGGKPEVLNLLSTSPELFNHLNKLESVMETLGGINSVVRGEVPSAGMSGAAMALLQSQAVQFVQGLQSSYVQLLEDLGTATIATLRDYATTKRVVQIVGKTNKSKLAEFNGDDLSTVNRVQVDVGNPLTRTTAGKLELAQMMLTAGMIKTPQELLGVIETGNLDTMTEGPMNELISIKSENETLGDGEPVPVMITDDHALHLSEHKALINDPEVRKDPARLQVAMQHIQEHWALWSDPANGPFLAALGQAPAPGGAPPAPMAGPGIDVGAADPAALVGAGANAVAAGMQPNLPQVPTVQ